MSTTTTLPAPVPAGRLLPLVAVPARTDPRRRGSLVLAERVVRKVAEQAAAEAGAVSGRAGRALGLGSNPDPDARPKVDVDLSASSADLALAVGIAYPASIRATTQRVREHVTRRVEELTGVDVRRVDIDVTVLSTAASDRGRQALR